MAERCQVVDAVLCFLIRDLRFYTAMEIHDVTSLGCDGCRDVVRFERSGGLCWQILTLQMEAVKSSHQVPQPKRPRLEFLCFLLFLQYLEITYRAPLSIMSRLLL